MPHSQQAVMRSNPLPNARWATATAANSKLCSAEEWRWLIVQRTSYGFTRNNRYGILCGSNRCMLCFTFSCFLCAFLSFANFKICICFSSSSVRRVAVAERCRSCRKYVLKWKPTAEHFSLDKCVKRLECCNRIRFRRPFRCAFFAQWAVSARCGN